jgi:hypothetical protein
MERWHLEHGVLLVVVIVCSGVDWSWLFVNDTEGEGEWTGVAGGSGDIGVGGVEYVAVSGSGNCFECPDGGGVSGLYALGGVISGVRGSISSILGSLTGVVSGVGGVVFACPDTRLAGREISLPIFREGEICTN